MMEKSSYNIIFFILMTFDVLNFDKSKEVNSKTSLNIPDISFTFKVFILPKVIFVSAADTMEKYRSSKMTPENLSGNVLIAATLMRTK